MIPFCPLNRPVLYACIFRWFRPPSPFDETSRIVCADIRRYSRVTDFGLITARHEHTGQQPGFQVAMEREEALGTGCLETRALHFIADERSASRQIVHSPSVHPLTFSAYFSSVPLSGSWFRGPVFLRLLHSPRRTTYFLSFGQVFPSPRAPRCESRFFVLVKNTENLDMPRDTASVYSPLHRPVKRPFDRA